MRTREPSEREAQEQRERSRRHRDSGSLADVMAVYHPNGYSGPSQPVQRSWWQRWLRA